MIDKELVVWQNYYGWHIYPNKSFWILLKDIWKINYYHNFHYRYGEYIHD